MILDSLFNNYCFWELVLISLAVKCHGSTIFNSLFSISKHLSIWVEFPIIFSILLFSRGIVSMSLFIHFMNNCILILECSLHWIEHVFCIFKTLRWYTKFMSCLIFYLSWPFIFSWKSLTKWLSLMRGIFVLLYVIEFIG